MPLEFSSYLRAYKHDKKLRGFCDEWLLAAATGGVDAEYDSRILRVVKERPDSALMCAVSLVELSSEEVADETLAGPFEALLASRGAEYIDVVCELSRAVRRLPRILGYIWGDHIPKAVTRKIELFSET